MLYICCQIIPDLFLAVDRGILGRQSIDSAELFALSSQECSILSPWKLGQLNFAGGTIKFNTHDGGETKFRVSWEPASMRAATTRENTR